MADEGQWDTFRVHITNSNKCNMHAHGSCGRHGGHRRGDGPTPTTARFICFCAARPVKNTANARSLLCHRDCTQNKARRFGFYTTPGDSGSGDGARSSRSRDASDLICLPGAAPAASHLPAAPPLPFPLPLPPKYTPGCTGPGGWPPNTHPPHGLLRPSSTFGRLRWRVCDGWRAACLPAARDLRAARGRARYYLR